MLKLSGGVVAALTVGVLIGLFVLIRGNSASADVVLDGVPPAALADEGYEASYAAAAEKAAVSEAGAASAAAKDSRG